MIKEKLLPRGVGRRRKDFDSESNGFFLQYPAEYFSKEQTKVKRDVDEKPQKGKKAKEWISKAEDAVRLAEESAQICFSSGIDCLENEKEREKLEEFMIMFGKAMLRLKTKCFSEDSGSGEGIEDMLILDKLSLENALESVTTDSVLTPEREDILAQHRMVAGEVETLCLPVLESKDETCVDYGNDNSSMDSPKVADDSFCLLKGLDRPSSPVRRSPRILSLRS